MRAPNWHAALLEVFESAHGKRFRWGQHDCCAFVARCIFAVTGENRRERFPRYRTRAEAFALLNQFGGMQGLLTHALGEPVPNKAFAGMGDIVLVDMGIGPQPAICMGVDSFAPGKRGLEYRKTLTASAAWIL